MSKRKQVLIVGAAIVAVIYWQSRPRNAAAAPVVAPKIPGPTGLDNVNLALMLPGLP